MDSPPLVSICIPNYNNAPFIEEAISSALNQTYENIEVIVVDNCSTDNSWEIISSIKHSKLIAFRNKENIGMVGNVKKVLSYAKGTCISFLCSDDYLKEYAIRENITLLQKYPQANFAFGNVEYIGNRKGQSSFYYKSFLDEGEWTKDSLKKAGNRAYLVGTVFKIKALQKLRGKVIEDLTFFDWFLWLRLGLGAAAFNPNIIGAYRYHSSNQTDLLTPGISQNYLHLYKVLQYFQENYPEEKDLVIIAQEELILKSAKLIFQKDSLTAAINFLRIHCQPSLSSIMKLVVIFTYSKFVRVRNTVLGYFGI